MRTTLELDDALMAALMARVPEASKTRAIEFAIREFLEADAYRVLADAARTGGVEIDPAAVADARGADTAREARLRELGAE